MPEREALFYEKLEEGLVKCQLCPHKCSLKEGQTGLCGVRSNRSNVLMTANYGEVSALALDPIEKKPLYHFYPGKSILSVGSFGCNFACQFCQNYQIAQEVPPSRYIPASELLEMAVSCLEDNSIGIAFTYNEPLIVYEYILDTALLLKDKGLKLVLVSNGFIEAEPLDRLLPYIDAVNIDVKAFNEEFYRRLCRGRLADVKKTVEKLSGKVHVEISTLIIGGVNDNALEMQNLACWLAELDQNIVLHLSRYYPAYKMTLPPTDEEIILQSCAIAKKYLPFVYAGNIVGRENNTFCQRCGNLLIKRSGYEVKINGIKADRCSQCGIKINYIVTC